MCLKIKMKNFAYFLYLFLQLVPQLLNLERSNITFDPRTIGMQIDDTIMQKNLS